MTQSSFTSSLRGRAFVLVTMSRIFRIAQATSATLATPSTRANPLVLVIGWWGAQDVHVEKYTKLFEVDRPSRVFYWLLLSGSRVLASVVVEHGVFCCKDGGADMGARAGSFWPAPIRQGDSSAACPGVPVASRENKRVHLHF